MSTASRKARPGSKSLLALLMAFTVGAFPSAVAYAQDAAAPNMDAMYAHLMKARAIAGNDLMQDFYHRCYIEPLYPNTLARSINATAAIPPAQVFDNLYFVGQNAVSSWVIKTSAGLILIDTENTPDEAKDYIEGGMAKLGLDATQIKYIVITHEHTDHFGGAKYLQAKYRQYGIHVVASAPAWKNMPTANRNAGYDPIHDMEIADGQKLTLGDTALTFYIMPGHSDGTISFFFNTTDHGRPHVIGFFGGMGSPKLEANRDKIISSYERWLKLAAAAGADTMIANHQGEDGAVEKIEFIRTRHPNDPNPFVLGKDGYKRYFEVQEECAKADLARNGQSIPQ
jgi:metallo-beta-lactamase class B